MSCRHAAPALALALLASGASAQDTALPPITIAPPAQAMARRAEQVQRPAARPRRSRMAVERPAPPQGGAIPTTSSGPAPGAGSPTAPSVAAQKAALAAIPGSVSLIDAASFQDRYTNNLPDILRDTPGVLAQPRYGQEIRLSVRGSGLGRNFHLRGIELLQDGIPLNFADGSGDFYGIDPLSLRSLELYRGGNALAYGTTTLGGALNAVTPTARTALAPTIVRLEGGSFGALRANLQVSRVEGPADALISATYSHQDGYRIHGNQDYLQLNGNVGYQIAPGIETRFYAGYAKTEQKLPGTLDLLQALTLPRAASLAALTGNQKRDVETSRIANRTSFVLDVGQLDLDTWLIHKRLFHPIFQVIDQTGNTYGIAPRWSGRFDLGGFANDLLVGARAVGGENTARQYVNVQGRSSGRLTAYARQEARNVEAFVDNRFWLASDLALVAGAKWFRHERDLTNLFTIPNREASRTYEGVNPKLGLLYTPLPDVQVFANLTRSRDVPDFSDLAQANTSGLVFVPLEAQKAWTAEIGTRGAWDRFRWEATLYRSWLRDELLAFTPNGALGIPAATFNAPRTSRAGVELAASAELLRDISGEGAGDMLTLSQVWTMTDARFVNDPVYGDNRIAAQPLHVLRSTLAYRHGGFFLAPSIDWVPVGAYADHANALRVPGYALIGLQAGMDLGRGVSVYLDARNLADRRYVSDIGAITDARRVSTAVFYPGEGRAVFAGVRWAY